MIKGTPIAKCFIKPDDPGNCLYLSDEEFVVALNNKYYHYNIEELQSLQWMNKILLLPMVSGGIMVSLSVFAYMNDVLHPWIFMPLLLIGFLLFYYGITGAPALVLTIKQHQEQYLFKKLNNFLPEFTDFINQYIVRRSLPDYFIHVPHAQYMAAKASGVLKISEPLEIFPSPSKTIETVSLHLDMSKFKSSIVYTRVGQNNDLKPFVTEDILLSAIQE